MPDLEFLSPIRDFMEAGGDVLLAIAFVTVLMWFMIIERVWYFRTAHRREVKRVMDIWAARSDHSSWTAHHVRRLLISEVQMKLERGLLLIRTLVALCPMLGLLGTVTGMVEVFEVMAIAGSGNVRGMADGVGKATLPTMAGMVAALSGLLFSVQLGRFAQQETQRFADHLEIIHE